MTYAQFQTAQLLSVTAMTCLIIVSLLCWCLLFDYNQRRSTKKLR